MRDFKEKLQLAEKMDSRYGSFDFPAIPEYDGVQPSYLPKKNMLPPKNSIPKPKPGNKMVQMTDPNQTAKSTVSLTSVNLEKINQRNADRLVRLDDGGLGDSGFQLTMNSAKKGSIADSSPGIPKQYNRIAAADGSRQGSGFGQPTSVLHVDRPQQKQISELEELDDMLADILRDKTT